MNKEKEKMYKDYKDTYSTGYINRYTFEFDFLPNVLPPLYKDGKTHFLYHGKGPDPGQ